MEYAVVFVTASGVEEGEKIARSLVETRLAACVNVVPGVRSFYWWKGKLEADSEVLLVIKTRRELVDDLTRRVKEIHSYEVCEVVALPVVGGSEAYLNWVLEETRRI